MRNHWKYKNLSIACVGVILAIILSRVEGFHSFLLHLGNFGYIGAFIAGMLFVSTFTIATSALVLLVIAETLSPIEIGLIAGLGAVVGDMLIFRFVKDGLSGEIEDIFKNFDKKRHIKHLFHSKYFNWMLPVIGAMIIASPFPDELGVSLMGISKMSTVKFVVMSYFLNSIGIFLIVSASVFIKP
ncbi:MAG: hypothetical protein ACD_61C00163G0005 [uncultured bacterium]|nr:MAG: hypothetical protein ACD_61C00163G0005 [uncultured bacterium]